jgi:hypothetical protein
LKEITAQINGSFYSKQLFSLRILLAICICSLVQQCFAIKIYGRITDEHSGDHIGGCLILIPKGYHGESDSIVSAPNGTFSLELDSIKDDYMCLEFSKEGYMPKYFWFSALRKTKRPQPCAPTTVLWAFALSGSVVLLLLTCQKLIGLQ